jgi:hypothetical protein
VVPQLKKPQLTLKLPQDQFVSKPMNLGDQNGLPYGKAFWVNSD